MSGPLTGRRFVKYVGPTAIFKCSVTGHDFIIMAPDPEALNEIVTRLMNLGSVDFSGVLDCELKKLPGSKPIVPVPLSQEKLP